MLSSPRSDLHPPSISRSFTPTGTRIVFADSNPNDLPVPNGAPGGLSGVNHLPATLFVIPPSGGATLVWLDVLGNSNAIVYLANAPPHTLPFTAQSIEAATGAGFLIVASWHPGA